MAYFTNSKADSCDSILNALSVEIELDSEESLLVYGFNLCAKSGMNSLELDFSILKSFAKKYGFDRFEILGIYKKNY